MPLLLLSVLSQGQVTVELMLFVDKLLTYCGLEREFFVILNTIGCGRTPDNTLKSLRKVQIRIGQNFRTSLSTVRIKIGQFRTEPLTPLPDKDPQPAGQPVHGPDKNRTSGFERPYFLLQCSSRVVVVA